MEEYILTINTDLLNFCPYCGNELYKSVKNKYIHINCCECEKFKIKEYLKTVNVK